MDPARIFLTIGGAYGFALLEKRAADAALVVLRPRG